MTRLKRRDLWPAALLAILMGGSAWAGEEVHGANASYLGPTIRIAWAVLRGSTADATKVVLRVVNNAHDYHFVRLDGSNPFTGQRTVLVAAAPLQESRDLAVPRARFAEFPRCEVRLYKSRATLAADQPDLAIFYLGVPDTTPEFTTESAASAYLGHMLGHPARGR